MKAPPNQQVVNMENVTSFLYFPNHLDHRLRMSGIIRGMV